MRVIGLTGGIASGKSTVADFFAERGVPVIDADQLAREVVEPGAPALAAIVETFGGAVLNGDGTLNRSRLGEQVFRDSRARRRLEAIMHPAIGRLAEEKLAALRAAGATVVIYMAALLIEAGVTDRVDEIWVVYVDRETQLARLTGRDGITREAAELKLAAQMPLAEKKGHGRVVIDNNGSRQSLNDQLAALWQREFSDCQPPARKRQKPRGGG
jgi:dephospho-CoA kinase